MSSERRHHNRVHKELKILWEDEDVAFDGLTLDICPGGVFVVTDRLLIPKSILTIKLWLGNDFFVQCRGEVVWLNRGEVTHYPPGFGIQFLDLPEDALSRILPMCTEPDQDWQGASGSLQ